MIMKVNLEYIYTIDYKQPRRQAWSDAQISDKVFVDFREVNSSDAPVCLYSKIKQRTITK